MFLEHNRAFPGKYIPPEKVRNVFFPFLRGLENMVCNTALIVENIKNAFF